MKLINKDAVLAEIERNKKHWINIERVSMEAGNMYSTNNYHGRIDMCNIFLSYIDTLEVKEVDLEKEIREEYLKRRYYGGRDNMLVILNEPQFNMIAKHFFELGLKAQKGE